MLRTEVGRKERRQIYRAARPGLPSSDLLQLGQHCLVPGRGSAETSEHQRHPTVCTEPRLMSHRVRRLNQCCLPLSSGAMLVTVLGRKAGVQFYSTPQNKNQKMIFSKPHNEAQGILEPVASSSCLHFLCGASL